jgi:hypothetical protein
MGSGYRVFTAGEVLTASNVQNYLQDQAVMVFGGTAARSSAIGTANFEEGMLTYLTDVDKLQVYTGAAFADVYPPAASAQGLTLINTTSFSGVASQSVNDVFSATYTNYFILVKAACSSAGQLSLRMRVSGTDLTSSSYMYGGAYTQYNGSATVTGENANGTPGAATTNGFNILDVDGNPSYARIQMFDPFETEQTGLIYDQAFNSGGSRNAGFWESFSGLTTVTTSYTGFTLLPAAGNITGYVRVYGYNQ